MSPRRIPASLYPSATSQPSGPPSVSITTLSRLSGTRPPPHHIISSPAPPVTSRRRPSPILFHRQSRLKCPLTIEAPSQGTFGSFPGVKTPTPRSAVRNMLSALHRRRSPPPRSCMSLETLRGRRGTHSPPRDSYCNVCLGACHCLLWIFILSRVWPRSQAIPTTAAFFFATSRPCQLD